MGRAKDITIKVIPSKVANDFVRRWHYSGRVVNNSILHFGAFLDGSLHGVMSFGPPMDKRKVLGLVKGTLWNEMLELNRMAFDDVLPRNSESRCIAIAMRLIRKKAPHIKWILSFSDATQCGDGAIYRASGFVLTGIKENESLLLFPDGSILSEITLRVNFTIPQIKELCKRMGLEHKYRTTTEWLKLGATKMPGYQLRYILLLDKSLEMTCPVLSFSKIDEMNAGMYKGEKVKQAERRPQAAIAHSGERRASSPEGAFDATAPLNSD